ncbi:MAG: SLBB domain-containing protein [Bacteroidetes bacterium]|nr:SLBB domain-containing protein [Bacteroidota bacterium]
MKLHHIFLVLLLFACRDISAQNQQIIEQQARSIIQSKGLDENEVKARLKQQGIDIENMTPEELAQSQSRIEAVVNDMEAEKKAAMEINTPVAEPAATTTVDTVAPKSETPPAPVETAKKNTLELPPTEIFGHHLFRAKDLSVYSTTSEVKPPDSYVLGPGDELTISIFGPSQFDNKFIINKEGYIAPLNMPKIFLKGISFGQARELLRSRFGGFYRFAPEQFAVSLSTARTISVNIFGEAVNIGSFTMSAVNTAFNALVAAGGPTELGTVRNIKLIRGRTSKQIDLYQFINNPSAQFEFSLENNDIIHIPVAERIISIQGAIRRPFKYELIQGENLVQLIAYAGGLNPNAYREIIQVNRFENDKRILIDVNLKTLLNNKQDFVLLNGDAVIVRTIPTPIENTAGIEGAVNLPGKYSISETPRISDLLKKGELRPQSRTDIAFLLRENTDGTKRLIQISPAELLAAPGSANDLTLNPKDVLTVYTQARYTDKSTISVRGAVREEVKNYPFAADSSITLERAILLAGGLSAEATGLGYIMRTNPNNTKEKSYLPINITAALQDPAGPANVRLQPFDEVVTLLAPVYTDVADVKIVGAVRTPGKFQYSPTLTLKDALILAGGMKMEAARNRIDIYRVDITANQPTHTLAISLEVDNDYNITNGGSNFSLQPFDEVVVRTAPQFQYQEFVELNGDVKYPGRYALIDENERLTDLIKRAGGLTTEADARAVTLFRTENDKGFVVTRLEAAMRAPNSSENHILKNGDVINVPKLQDLVTIRAVNTDLSQILNTQAGKTGQISVAWHSSRRAGWYVREYAGGFAKNANKKKVKVEQPNGKVNRTKSFWFFRIYPKVVKGSVVFVPAEPPKESKPKEKKNIDWDKKLTQILAVTGVITSAAIAIAAFK